MNGFGGKVNEGEDPDDGALREPSEELQITAEESLLSYAGLVRDGVKQIYVFTYGMTEKKDPNPNLSEISGAGWYGLAERGLYMGEMLSGDDLVLDNLELRIEGGVTEPFFIDKTGDARLSEQTKNISF